MSHSATGGGIGVPEEVLRRFLVQGRVSPPLDPGFRPAILARRTLADAAGRSPRGQPVWVAVEQPGASVCIRDAWVLNEPDVAAPLSYALFERLAKTMLVKTE